MVVYVSAIAIWLYQRYIFSASLTIFLDRYRGFGLYPLMVKHWILLDMPCFVQVAFD